MNNAATVDPTALRLPRLRDGLELVDVSTPTERVWTVHDPLRDRYCRVGWLEFELLARLGLGRVDSILDAVRNDTPLHAELEDLERLVKLLEDEELVHEADDTDRLLRHKAARKTGTHTRLFRLSMYARRRLLNPGPILDRWCHRLDPVFAHHQAFTLITACAAIIGLLLLVGHASEFHATLTGYLNTSGMIAFIAALVVGNTLHEFGHGLMATRFGCRVRAMGVALIFLIPVAWCDTSDAWRLRSRRQRLLIDAGGIIVEGLLAIAALWAWLLLPEGTLRAIAFFVAVTAIATSVLINLNPFMKFDGYYLLSDALGIENLQSTSFETLRWRMRMALTNLPAPRPAHSAASQERVLCLYAAGTWLYRVFLFLGISWLVYSFWFKALGVVMALAVIVTLLLKPIVKELVYMSGDIRQRGATGRAYVNLLFLLGLTTLCVVPLPRAIHAPAVLSVQHSTHVFAPAVAKIEQIHVASGDRVSSGERLVTLVDPALEKELESARVTLDTLLESRRQDGRGRRQIVEVPASFQTRGDDLPTLPDDDILWGDEALDEVQTRMRHIEQQQQRLIVSATHDGVIVDLDDTLQRGRWLAENDLLGAIVSDATPQIRAYVKAAQLRRLPEQQSDNTFRSTSGFTVAVSISSVAQNTETVLDDVALAIPNGGDIAVAGVAKDGLQGAAIEPGLLPRQDWHRITLSTTTDTHIEREHTGYVRLQGSAESIAAQAARRLYGFFIRESGF